MLLITISRFIYLLTLLCLQIILDYFISSYFRYSFVMYNSIKRTIFKYPDVLLNFKMISIILLFKQSNAPKGHFPLIIQKNKFNTNNDKIKSKMYTFAYKIPNNI